MTISVDLLLEDKENIGIVDGRAELPFVVLGTPSSYAARLAAFAYLQGLGISKSYHGLSIMDVTLNRATAPDIFMGNVVYQQLLKKIKFSYDCLAEKTKKTTCLEEVANYRVRDIENLGWQGPSFDRLVNVGKKKVDGVDVYDAHSAGKLVMQWSDKFADITAGYMDTVESLKASVNDRPITLNYRGQSILYQKGELLCLGGTFNESAHDENAINVHFLVNRSNSFIEIGEIDGTSGVSYTEAASLVSGSMTVSNVAGTDLLLAGMSVSGTGIPNGAFITAVGGTTVVISEPATATGSQNLTFWLPYLFKEGHNYGWIRTVTEEGPDGIEVEVPDSFHVGRFYEYKNFDVLDVFGRFQYFDDQLTGELEEFRSAHEDDWV